MKRIDILSFSRWPLRLLMIVQLTVICPLPSSAQCHAGCKRVTLHAYHAQVDMVNDTDQPMLVSGFVAFGSGSTCPPCGSCNFGVREDAKSPQVSLMSYLRQCPGITPNGTVLSSNMMQGGWRASGAELPPRTPVFTQRQTFWTDRPVSGVSDWSVSYRFGSMRNAAISAGGSVEVATDDGVTVRQTYLTGMNLFDDGKLRASFQLSSCGEVTFCPDHCLINGHTAEKEDLEESELDDGLIFSDLEEPIDPTILNNIMRTESANIARIVDDVYSGILSESEAKQQIINQSSRRTLEWSKALAQDGYVDNSNSYSSAASSQHSSSSENQCDRSYNQKLSELKTKVDNFNRCAKGIRASSFGGRSPSSEDHHNEILSRCGNYRVTQCDRPKIEVERLECMQKGLNTVSSEIRSVSVSDDDNLNAWGKDVAKSQLSKTNSSISNVLESARQNLRQRQTEGCKVNWAPMSFELSNP